MENGVKVRGRDKSLAAHGLSAWCSLAAKLLKITVPVAQEWVEAGRLPAIRIFGGVLHGHVLIRRAGLYCLLAPLGWATG